MTLDADASAFTNGAVAADFTGIAWAIAKHESRQLNRVYNQFNSRTTDFAQVGTLNYGFPNGWGIAQIDRENDEGGVTTAEVWDWHENINALNNKLIDKRDNFYTRFIGYFRSAYGEQANWSEPPVTYEIGETTLTAQEWGVLILYNGTAEVPQSQVPGHKQKFRSPWTFNPNSGKWSFHDNTNPISGEHYAAQMSIEIPGVASEE